MLDIFRELRGLLRVSHIHIDSWVFRLHYSVSTTFLLAFSLIISAKQYVGNPIDCIHSKDIPEEVLNTYCWIHSTYTIPSAFWKRIGFDVAHPGVDKTIDPEERRYHKYYQWVCFCLFFQVREIWRLITTCSRVQEFNHNCVQGQRKQIFYGEATVNSEKRIFKKFPKFTK